MQREPIFNAPAVVVASLALLVAVHVARQLIGEATDEWVILVGAFIPARYDGLALPGGEVAKATSFLSHALLHADWLHLAVNGGWLLAFGSIVARRLVAGRFLLLSAVAAIAGAALFLAVNWGLPQPMVGASGAISGLMGAAMRFMFLPGGADAEASPFRRRRSMTFMEMMQDRRARLMILSWLGLNLLFGLLLGSMFSAGGIAWEAHLGGFIAGMALLPLLEPGSAGHEHY